MCWMKVAYLHTPDLESKSNQWSEINSVSEKPPPPRKNHLVLIIYPPTVTFQSRRTPYMRIGFLDTSMKVMWPHDTQGDGQAQPSPCG